MRIVAKPIDAIVKFKGTDKPIPYKFRYEDAEGHYREVKIDKIISTEEFKIAGIRTFIYCCQSNINQEEKLYELKYILQNCRWELYKV